MNGICHVEIPTTDLEATKAHLGGLFGWEFEPMNEDYCLFRTAEGPGGGLERVPAPKGERAIGIYIEVGSIDDCLAKSGKLGGEVVKGKTPIAPGFGSYAEMRDPGGTVIGIWEASA